LRVEFHVDGRVFRVRDFGRRDLRLMVMFEWPGIDGNYAVSHFAGKSAGGIEGAVAECLIDPQFPPQR